MGSPDIIEIDIHSWENLERVHILVETKHRPSITGHLAVCLRINLSFEKRLWVLGELAAGAVWFLSGNQAVPES